MARQSWTQREAELLDLIGAIYDVALAPQDLPLLLSRLTRLCGGVWAPLSVLPLNGGNGLTVQNADADPSHLALFHRKYATPDTNPSIPRLMASPRGKIILREEHFSDAVWERIDMYQELYRPIGAYASLGVVLLRTEHHFVPFGMLRPKSVGGFDAGQLALLARAIPHLQRMMQILLRLNDLETRAAADEVLWDRLPYGVVLLDEIGRILWANSAADTMLSSGEGLTTRGGFLCAAGANESAALQRLIGEAAQTGSGHGVGAGGALALPRGSEARPLAVLVAPFRVGRAEHIAVARRPAVVVLVSDPDRKPQAAADLLAQLYGLTGRERALVGLLLEGFDLREAAGRLGVGMNTVRTHLRQVFEKTNTHRQAELVSLLLRSVVTLRRGN